ncbi:MAG: radical SAM protein [Rhodospirillales bacterium 20-64-7]|nr:MAG: radical SAM protein [Rhodospirillales bacterium 20-64-7]HQT75781.1 radical SAM protein [Rhodopila sp.]
MLDSASIDSVRIDTPTIPTIVSSEPVLVFGGCYSNLQATEALLDRARQLGVTPDRMICTGDVIAYGADPHETLALIRKAGIATVMGNCEESLAQDAGDCGCGFAPGSACDRLSAAWFTYATKHVDQADRLWMAALPQRIDLLLGGYRLAVVHGAPSRINRFVFASTPDPDIMTELALAGADGVIGGHCGVPFTRRINSLLWHNSGAIGMPANDGTARGWFSLLTPHADGIEIRHLPLDYDHHAAAQAMRVAGLPVDYADTMESGIWPSFDVLPATEQAQTGRALTLGTSKWDGQSRPEQPAPELRFTNPARTAAGEAHASVVLDGLNTLWFNTGTLCNIACTGCYIESTPRNDRLIYLSRADFDRFMDEAAALHPELREIGFTGGEPFMNPDAPGMIEAALARGYRVLVLTNAMRPMQRHLPLLERLHATYGSRLALRISLDHYTPEGHETVRGAGSFAPALAGLSWLASQGFELAVAARFGAGETEAAFRAGFAAMFRDHGLTLDATDPERLVLFPELADQELPPEVSEACWQALHSRGRSVMCQFSRMVVHRKGEAAPRVAACTLLPYADGFDLGGSLAEAVGPVTLNHPYCARFCVFGAASCTA